MMLSSPIQMKAERTSSRTLLIRKTYGRRLLFLATGVLLILVFVLGSAPDRDNDTAPSFMTYVVALLTVVCFFVAAHDKRIIFNSATDELVFRYLIAFVPVRTSKRALSDVRSVMLTHFPMSRKKTVTRRALFSSESSLDGEERPRGFLKLYLETSDERILVECRIKHNVSDDLVSQPFRRLTRAISTISSESNTL